MTQKHLIPLIGVLLMLACSLPALLTATPTAIPATDTVTPFVPTQTETPAATSTTTPSATATVSAVPTQRVPIPHLTAGQAIKITYIHMLDVSNGWGIGGLNGASDHVLHTTDGGQTWEDLTPPELALVSGGKSAIGFFLDASKAWVVYASNDDIPLDQAYVWYTQDGGSTWQASELNDPDLFSEMYAPGELFFVDAQHGWLLIHVGAGMNHDYYVLLGTSDGGATWQTLISATGDTSGTQSCTKTGLVFATDQVGWMTIDCHGVAPVPYFFKTSDGGATWSKVELPTPTGTSNLFDQWYCGIHSPTLFTATAGDFVLQCNQFDSGQTTKAYLYATEDSGVSWNSYAYPGGNLQFVTDTIAFALSRDIQRSGNAGHSWSFVKKVNWDGQFSFVDASRVWAVARDDDQIALVDSANGGQLWEEIHPTIAP
jgi:photosystem II stability/assembly factor-like uncharacterized protein